MADRELIFDIVGRDRASDAFSSAAKGAEGMGGRVSKVGVGLTKTLTPAAAGVGLAFKQAFGEFDAGADAIRASTGATGKALEGMTKSMKSVGAGVAEPLSKVGEAIGLVNQRLDITGKPLEALSKQFLNLAHVTGTDVASNVDAVTGLFNNFGVATKDQSAKLDELFRASQASGVSVAQLASDMASGGVVLRQAGLNFEQSAALLAGLGKAGLSASDVMPALGKSLATAAKDGKSASELLGDTFARIKDAPDATKAAGVALEVFGAKAGPKLAALIREGKLSLDELTKSITTGDSINKAAADTADWAEKWQMMKNRLQAVIGPFGQTGMAIAGMAAGIGPVVVGLGKIGPAVGKAASGFGSFAASAASGAASVVASIAKAAAAAVAQGARMVASFAATAAAAVASAAATVAAWVVAAAPFIALGAAIAAVVIVVVKNWDTIKAATSAAWEAVVGFVKGAWDRVTGVISAAIRVLTDLFLNFTGPGLIIKHFDSIVGFVRAMPGRIADVAKGMFNGIRDAFKSAINFIIRGWNHLEFKVPGFKVGPVHFGGFTLGMPNIKELHSGGPVTADFPRFPGLASDERLAVLQVGEHVTPRGGGAGGLTQHITVTGQDRPRATAAAIIDAGRAEAWLAGADV